MFCHQLGRIYFGQYNLNGCGSAPNSTLWSYRKDEGVKVVLTGLLSNTGLAWSLKAKKFYRIEACRYRVFGYDWDPKTGQISE